MGSTEAARRLGQCEEAGRPGSGHLAKAGAEAPEDPCSCQDATRKEECSVHPLTALPFERLRLPPWANTLDQRGGSRE